MNLSGLGLSGREKAAVVVMYGILAALTLLGFAASALIGRSYVVLAGLGIAAYVFGLRHGFDADHIAAIDNTVRKLLQEGKRPLAVGTWFSLGHSTVVVALILALTISTRAVAGSIPQLRSVGAILGSAASGVFLYLIGLVNVVILVEIYRTFRSIRRSPSEETRLDSLSKSGFMSKYFGRLFGIVRSPWQIFPIGLLFGLGFDTASEVALIAVAVGAGVTSSVPIWMILVLPLMFACGMVLVDMSDGISMRLAYGWAFLKPIRKIYYNMMVTLVSVLLAFIIGSVELGQVISNELGLHGGLWAWVDGLDFETLGYLIVSTFIVTWIASVAYYKYKGFERSPARSVGYESDSGVPT